MDSWLPIHEKPEFSLASLPYGIFSTSHDATKRIGVAIGSHVLDLKILGQKQIFHHLEFDTSTLQESTLNSFASLGREVQRKVTNHLRELLKVDTSLGHVLRDDPALRYLSIESMKDVQMHLPMDIGDYTDFFTSPYHAQNCTDIVRPGTKLQSNFWNIPLGYHGRASSIVVSGTSIRRPPGYYLLNGSPTFGLSQKLDFEVELAAFIGKGNEMGTSIAVNDAEAHIFGLVLLNDWSARDIQRAEAGLLGPLCGKNFATTISPWVVPLDAFERCRVKPLPQGTPLPYLVSTSEDTVFDIAIHAFLQVGSEQYQVGQCNAKNIIFSFAQMLAHHTAGGCPMRAGDLIATGTLSGATGTELGCLLEMTNDGQAPVQLESNNPQSTPLRRAWLEDADGVIFKVGDGGYGNMGFGLGSCEGKILPYD